MVVIFGVVIVGLFVEMGVLCILLFVKCLIMLFVIGIVVLLIGFMLIKVGFISMGGGYGVMVKGMFVSVENFMLLGFVFGMIILLNCVLVVWVCSIVFVIVFVIGYFVVVFFGCFDFIGMYQVVLFQVLMLLYFGIGFLWVLFVLMLIIYFVMLFEVIGDVMVISKILNELVEGLVWMQCIKGGVFVNGVNLLLVGVFNMFLSLVFVQNNGVIQIIGVVSCYVGIWIVGMLVVFGLFLVVVGVLQVVLELVFGGVVMVMFGVVVVLGINIFVGVYFDCCVLLIIVVLFVFGFGVLQVLDILNSLLYVLKNVLELGVVMGGICVFVMNWFLLEKK